MMWICLDSKGAVMMSLVKDIIENFRSKDSKDDEWNAYWQQVKEEELLLEFYLAGIDKLSHTKITSF